MPRCRSAGCAVLIAAALVLGLPAVAYAGAFSTYVTTVTSVTPAVAGISATAARNGESITVRNQSGTALVVDGYQGEPYLKITAHGVWENERSPAVYLNKEQTIGNIPDSADARRPPQWKKLDDGDVATWHDHRIHWMGNTDPPSVAEDPDHRHLITRWRIPTVAGAKQGRIVGTLVYEPATKHLGTWITVGVGVAALVAVLALNLVVRRRRRPVEDPVRG
ncbi:hypothetical protein [Nocardioides sp. KR10-350]|uniref:hypothetical protein n=1 Tax=Nocardioides cheoyonin TaxID=3156615 RepID=UPI0032B624B8